jgi:hypothetical protein
MTNIEVEATKRWCEQEFGVQWNAIGERSGTWTVFWNGPGSRRVNGDGGNYIWRFDNAEAVAWFKLHWCK